MQTEKSASAAFAIIAQTTRILEDAVRDGREFTSEITADITAGQEARATGGYQILITVQPRDNRGSPEGHERKEKAP
jgi:hypothetical protein